MVKPGDFTKYATGGAEAAVGFLGLPAIAGGIEGASRGLWSGLRGAARPKNTGLLSGLATGTGVLGELGGGIGRLPGDMMRDPSLLAFGLGIPGAAGVAGGAVGSRAGHLLGRGGRALAKRMGYLQEVVPEVAKPLTKREQLMSALHSLTTADQAIIGGSALAGLGAGKALSD